MNHDLTKNANDIHDQLLVLRCQNNDIAALTELVGRWRRRLLRHAFCLLGEKEEAEDVTQEAWIAIVRGITRLKDPALFAGWAFRIVTNKCMDSLRRSRRIEKVDELLQVSEEREVNVGSESETTQLVLESLKKLPGSAQAILSLKYLEDRSINEISQIMGIPPGTVKSRLFAARDKLKTGIERSM